jgi:hypothetical protein
MTTTIKRSQPAMSYRKLAQGYEILNSPLAAPFHAAADHYDHAERLADSLGLDSSLAYPKSQLTT